MYLLFILGIQVRAFTNHYIFVICNSAIIMIYYVCYTTHVQNFHVKGKPLKVQSYNKPIILCEIIKNHVYVVNAYTNNSLLYSFYEISYIHNLFCNVEESASFANPNILQE